MLNRIMVPVDGSGLAERALTYAHAFAEKTGAQILLLRATSSHTMAGVDPRERQLGAINESQEYVDQLVGASQSARDQM
jgi:nucleotide-binding universal stress UspA family protein